MFPAFLLSQSSLKIVGRVVDSETNEPLPGANVQVVGTALGAATNFMGRFEIENLLNGRYILKAGFIGYETVEHDVIVSDGQPADILFHLKRKVIEMDKVHVTAERFKDHHADDLVILSQRDIQRRGASTVGELLTSIPGIEMIDSGPQGEKKVTIRGSRANQVLVLLDGLKLNDAMTGEVDLSLIPTNAIERIEIHKGSAAAEYGSGAIGGVIYIYSAQSRDDVLSMSAKAGSYGFANLEPSLAGQWKGLTILASSQFLRSNGSYPFFFLGADDVPNSDTRFNADMWSNNYFARLGYSFKNHRIGLRYQKFASERGNPGRVHYLTPFARSSLDREIWSGDYHVVKKSWDLRLEAHLAGNTSQSSNLKPAVPDKPFGSTPQFHFQNTLRTIDYKATFQQQTVSWLINRLGYESKTLLFKDQNLRAPDNSAIGKAEDKSCAVFLIQEYQFSLSKLSLHISPAIRFDNAHLQSGGVDRRENQTSPQCRAFLSYGATNRVYLGGTVGRSFRMPTFADLFYQEFRVQGVPDLLPEKSLNRVLDAGCQFTGFGIWQLKASTFRNTINDMIVWRLGSFEFFRPYNTDAEIFGSEYVMSYSSRAEHITFSAGYTHLRPLNKNDNKTLYDKFLIYRPEHSITAGLDVEFPSWRTSLFYRHVGERFVTEANTKTMPAYAVLDWTAHVIIKTGKIKYQWQAAIYNLLDEQYQIIRDMPLPGREWRCGLRVSY